MKWYKRDPDAALAGMVELTLEERGAYNTVIDLLYSRDGNLPADDCFFARACNCRPHTWRRLRDNLLAKGKLHMIDGKLTANRVAGELEHARKLMFQSQLNRDSTRFQRPISDRKLKEINGRDGIARALQPHPDIYLVPSRERGGGSRKRLVDEGRGRDTHARLMSQGLKPKEST